MMKWIVLFLSFPSKVWMPIGLVGCFLALLYSSSTSKYVTVLDYAGCSLSLSQTIKRNVSLSLSGSGSGRMMTV